MASTYTPIATLNGTGSNEVITFNSIPSTYTDLIVVINGLPTGTNAQPCITVNNNTSNYSQTNLYGNGSSATSDRRTSQGQLVLTDYNSISNTNPSSIIIQIMNYSNSTYKTFLSRWGLASVGTMATVGLWANTSAISRLDLSTIVVGNYWSTSTMVTLYGIASA